MCPARPRFCHSNTLRLLCSSICLVIGLSSNAFAGMQFPYEAQTNTADVAVHSGPGSRFYLTGALKKGEKVQVHRHDPGGWYMIVPPEGSYSLVRAEYVKKEGGGSGVIAENNVIVRVGSQLSDHHEVAQRRLMKGDKVRILGEEQIEDRGRVVSMFKVEPPRGEFRWVKGDFLIPVDSNLRKEHDTNPFAFPSNGVELELKEPVERKPVDRYPVAEQKSAYFVVDSQEKTMRVDRPEEQWSTETGVVANNVDLKAIEKDRDILDALDRNFRSMIDQDISQWKLNDLQHDYQKLQKNTKIDAIASQVELRMQAMEKYRKLKAEFDELDRLSRATDQRDAELASMKAETSIAALQNQSPFSESEQYAFGQPSDNFAFPTAETGFLPDLGPDPNGNNQPSNESMAFGGHTFQPSEQTAQLPQQETAFFPNPNPDPRNPTPDYPTPTPDPLFGNGVAPPQVAATPSPQNQMQHNQVTQNQIPQNQPGYVGAGIVQRVPNWNGRSPQHALVTPQGQFLAYLHPQAGINLDAYIGQSVGLQGGRQHIPALGTDVITVTGLNAVQLNPQAPLYR